MEVLTPTEIAELLGASRQQTTRWCRKGMLKSKVYPHGERVRYEITMEHFIAFLCECPAQRRNFINNHSIHGSDIYRKIQFELSQRKDNIVYSFIDVARICDVTENTIRRWAKVGYLLPDLPNNKISGKALQRLFKVHPKSKRYVKSEELI